MAATAVSDLDELASLLARNGVLGTCGARLEALCAETLPSSFVEAVEAATARLPARALLLETVTTGVLAKLEAAGIPALPLKGILLARRIHRAAPLRPSNDIDILVRRSDISAASEIIQSAGYLPPSDVALVDGLPNLHYVLAAAGGALPNVELHWRIHWFETTFSAQMLDRSALDDEGIRRAAPADELAALLLFYQRDSFLGLKLAADISAWWDTYGSELAPGALAGVAAEHPELRDALVASAAVVEWLLDVPATSLVETEPIRPRRTAWAARLGEWSSGTMSPQEIANMSLIDWLLTPPGERWAYVRRYLLQPPVIFAREHDLPEKARARDHVRRVGHAVARSAKMALRLTLALWRIRRGRVWTPLPASLADRRLAVGPLAKRKKAARPAVVRACDAMPSARSDSPSSQTSHYQESPRPATTDTGRV